MKVALEKCLERKCRNMLHLSILKENKKAFSFNMQNNVKKIVEMPR